MKYLTALVLFLPASITVILVRSILAFLGVFIVPFVVYYCQKNNLQQFPKWAYLWDNDEDGYTGNQRWHWWDVHLDGKKWPDKLRTWYGRTDLTFWQRYRRSVQWSVWRNPVNNMQRHPQLSWPVLTPDWVKVIAGVKGHVIFIKPQGSWFYHVGWRWNITDKFGIRGGIKLKPEYFNEGYELDEYRTRTTYTLGRT